MSSTKVHYEVGAGIANVTDPAIGLAMQGMADPSQKTNGVEFPLYSRAFILSEQGKQQRIAIVVVDIWSCTAAIKKEVIERLRIKFISLYSQENVLISGTHTHSGPGGFSQSELYEHVSGGFDPHNFECIVSGIVESIEKAHSNLEPGRAYICRDRLSDCGRQRSLEAYLNNPSYERTQYKTTADEEILLLKFVAINDKGEKHPIGLLNWHAIHPTDRGQSTSLVNGDNKGYAARLFEKHMQAKRSETATSCRPFVAAFANANCGDVSGNVEFGHMPNGISDKGHMQLHGEKLFAKVVEMFDRATVELTGKIDYRHTYVDMANVSIENMPGKRTWPAALGLSFAAGSTEDSVPKVAIANFTIPAPAVKEGAVAGNLSLREKITQTIAQLTLSLTFGKPLFNQTLTNRSLTAGQWPKPIILAAGLINPPIVPSVLPLQLLQIGNLVITGLPGEFTTMAGRRIRKTLLSELKELAIEYIALATYANDYSLYITTKEEYEKQHYEGAATLYGPYTLAAYQQELTQLAKGLVNGSEAGTGPTPPVQEVSINRRITIRSLSEKPVTLEIFRCGGESQGGHIAALNVASQSDRAYFLPKNINEISIVVNNSYIVKNVKHHHLLTIHKSGEKQLSEYIKHNSWT
ncbi:MAG: neutral/alkaline non-lysosomal ceramidase N-terminal domain-containing protein [Cyanobacteria bacterium P01_D01_bin.36]